MLLKCPDNSGKYFSEFGETMIDTNGEYSYCSHCPFKKNEHYGFNSNESINYIEIQNKLNEILENTYEEYISLNDFYKEQIIKLSCGNISSAKALSLAIIQLINNNEEKKLNSLLKKITNKDNLWYILREVPEYEKYNFYKIVLNKYNI